MSKIIFFIVPKSLIKAATKGSELVPIIGPAVQYTKKAQKITAIANPIVAATRGVDVLFNFCFGKAAVLSFDCALWFGFSVIGGITGNAVLIAAGAEFGSIIIDEIID